MGRKYLKGAILAISILASAAFLMASPGKKAYAGDAYPAAVKNDTDSYSGIKALLNARLPQTREQFHGTCWAFAPIAAAEANMIKKGYATTDVNYSELALAYESYFPAGDPLGGTNGKTMQFLSKGNYLNTGGNYLLSVNTLAGWRGVIDETDAVSEKDADRNTVVPADKAYDQKDRQVSDEAHLVSAYEMNIHKNPGTVKAAIKKYGAVAASIIMTSKANAEYYAFFRKAYDSFYNNSYEVNDESGEYSTNHAVAIVGWDDDFSREHFNGTPSGNGAWLVRNSWSSTSAFSIRSYFWMSYYDYGLKDTVYAMDFEKESAHDNNYQYDESPTRVAGDWKKCANVFTVKASGAEELSSVMVDSDKGGLKYTISIYLNPTDRNNPETGVLAECQSGTFPYAGYQSITLKKPVYMEKGTRFAIVVETSAEYCVRAEAPFYHEGWFLSSPYALSGESLICMNGKWADANDSVVRVPVMDEWFDKLSYWKTGNWKSLGMGNFRIKGITNNVPANASRRLDSRWKTTTEFGLKKGKVAGLKQTSAKVKQIGISWNPVVSAKGYGIYYRTKKKGKWKLAKYVGGTAKTAVFSKKLGKTKLKASKKYYLSVKAYMEWNGKKIWSNMVSGFTCATSPGKVSGFSARKAGKSAVLKWKKVSDADGYLIYRKEGSGAWKKAKTLNGGKKTSAKLGGLKKKKKYSFKICAFKKAGGFKACGKNGKVAIRS